MILDGSPIKKLLLRLFSQSPNPQCLFNHISTKSFPFPLLKILQCIKYTFRIFPLRLFLNGKIQSRYRSNRLSSPTSLNKSPPTTECPVVSLLILSLCQRQNPSIVFTGSLSTPINTSLPFNFIAHGWSTASRLEGAIGLQNTTTTAIPLRLKKINKKLRRFYSRNRRQRIIRWLQLNSTFSENTPPTTIKKSTDQSHSCKLTWTKVEPLVAFG